MERWDGEKELVLGGVLGVRGGLSDGEYLRED